MGEEAKTLEHTPTWVVAAVCTVIVAISLAMERLLHYLGKFLRHKGQSSLFSALQKIKEELMLLGFISLLLTVLQNTIVKICVRESFSSHMLPCPNKHTSKSSDQQIENGFCTKEGDVPLLSVEALHQLHIFIFVLAVAHVIFSATTMILGGAKIRRWKHWEISIQNEITELQKSNQGLGKHLMRPDDHKMFIQNRAGNYWRKSAVISWMIAFMKQFHSSVSKSDYRALRAGFIMKHCQSNPKFDFHKYILKTLEDDFKKVVGISWYLWLFVIIFLLLNVNGWHAYFWLSFLPLILLLVVGAKLEHVITRIAQEAAQEIILNNNNNNNNDNNNNNNNNTNRGINRRRQEAGPHVRPSDEHFWFGRPDIILYLIHFTLFQNSFEMAFFFWIWTMYGINSCIMESMQYLIPRLLMGIIIQVLCSYSTLPLYAIVTQMGDMFKQGIFNEYMQEYIHGWAEGARKKKRKSIHQNSFLGPISQRMNSDLSSSFGEIQSARLESFYGENSHDNDNNNSWKQDCDLKENV